MARNRTRDGSGLSSGKCRIHVCRQCGDETHPATQTFRRHRYRKHVRRYPHRRSQCHHRLIRLAAFRFYRYPHLAVRTDPRFLSSGRRQKCGQSSGNHFIRRYDVRICLQPESSRSKHPPGSRSFDRSRYRYRRYR